MNDIQVFSIFGIVGGIAASILTTTLIIRTIRQALQRDLSAVQRTREEIEWLKIRRILCLFAFLYAFSVFAAICLFLTIVMDRDGFALFTLLFSTTVASTFAGIIWYFSDPIRLKRWKAARKPIDTPTETSTP